MDAAIDEKEAEQQKSSGSKFTSSNVSSDLSDEEFWRLKLTS